MGKALNNTIYYTVGAIVKALASFFLLPVFTNILGAAQYGILNLLQTFSTILAVVMTLAVERSLYRLYYDYHIEEEQNRFLSSVFWLICINSGVIIVLSVFLGGYIIPYIGNVDIYKVLLPVVFYTFLSAVINFSQIVMQVEQNGKQFLVISLLILVIYNLIALTLVSFYLPTVQSMVYASFATFFVVAPIAFFRIKKKIQFIIDKQCILVVFRYSSPMLLMIIFAWVLNFSDRLFIANLSSYENVGVYSLAAKIVSIITLFSGTIFQAYGPFFYNIANTLPESEAKPKLREANSTITLLVCLLGISIVLFSRTILHLFFSEEYESALPFIYLLTISAVFTQQSGLLNVMIYQNKKTLGISLITITTGILSVVLNYWFIPIVGALFAGISNLIVGLFMISLTFMLARRNYYIEINFPLLFYGLAFILTCVAVDYMLISQWSSLVLKVLLFWGWLLLGARVNIIKQEALKRVYQAMRKNLKNTKNSSPKMGKFVDKCN